jgi:hypothetical protein
MLPVELQVPRNLHGVEPRSNRFLHYRRSVSSGRDEVDCGVQVVFSNEVTAVCTTAGLLAPP